MFVAKIFINTLCVVLVISICSFVNAQDSNTSLPVNTPALDSSGVDDGTPLKEGVNSTSENIKEITEGAEESNVSPGDITAGTLVTKTEVSVNEMSETLPVQESQFSKMLMQLKADQNMQFLLFTALMAILTLAVCLWQSTFGVPKWLAGTSEDQEKNGKDDEEPVDEPLKIVQHKITDDIAIELAVQVWRLEKRVSQLDLNESPKLLRRMTDSVDKFKQLLDDNKIVVDDPVNRKYVDGWLEVKAVAWEDVTLEKCPDNIGADPFVLETIRPIVRRDGRPISIGQIIVAECEGEKIL